MIPLFFVAALFSPLFPRRVFAYSVIPGGKRKFLSKRQASKVFAPITTLAMAVVYSFRIRLKVFLQHPRESRKPCDPHRSFDSFNNVAARPFDVINAREIKSRLSFFSNHFSSFMLESRFRLQQIIAFRLAARIFASGRGETSSMGIFRQHNVLSNS